MEWVIPMIIVALFSAGAGGAAGLAFANLHDPGKVECANLKIQVERVKQALENTK